jgi:hypothetical protein
MKRVSLVIAAVLILGAGTVHGVWMDRWGLSRDLENAKVRIPQLPMTIGDWAGESIEEDEATLKRYKEAGMDVLIQRRYTDRKTGDGVSMLAVCGRTGPISTHTPQACYGMSGFAEGGPPSHFAPGAEGLDYKADFWWMDFQRADSAISGALRIFYSWAGRDKRWKAVENARRDFALSKALYKVYVIEEGSRKGAPRENDPGPRFLAVLLPEFKKVVFDGSDAAN